MNLSNLIVWATVAHNAVSNNDCYVPAKLIVWCNFNCCNVEMKHIYILISGPYKEKCSMALAKYDEDIQS